MVMPEFLWHAFGLGDADFATMLKAWSSGSNILSLKRQCHIGVLPEAKKLICETLFRHPCNMSNSSVPVWERRTGQPHWPYGRKLRFYR